MKDRSHDYAMAERFKEDPVFAAGYANQLLQDGESADPLIVLRKIAQARRRVRAIAKETDLNSKQLYRALSQRGSPQPRSLSAVLKARDLRLTVQVAPERHKAAM